MISDARTTKQYYKCGHCAFIFLDPAQIVAPVTEKKRYEQHQNSFENAGYVQMFRTFIEQIKPFLKEPTERALDFGCGPVPVLARLLENEGIKEVHVYDKYFYPGRTLKKTDYDLITCTEVVEHLAEPLKYFKLFHSLLSECGMLAVSTNFYPPAPGDFIKWWYKNDITHISFFSMRTISWIAAHLGYQPAFLNQKNIFLLTK
jgi:hypothetical protein